MTTNIISTPSLFSIKFHEGIISIQQNAIETDDFHRKLYFSNVISLMEKYLSDLFLYEITTKDEIFKLMVSAQKFQSQKYPVSEIFNGDVKAKVINSVKNLVWHRLNDIDPLYKHTVDIRMHIHTGLTDKIALRHDLIHRNGFTIDGDPVVISNEELTNCINVISTFVNNVETKYQAYLQKES